MFKLVMLFCAIACVFGMHNNCLMYKHPVCSTPLSRSSSHRSIIPRFTSRPDDRIVGGEETTIEQFPYHASLRRRGSHICGAAIISEHILLTAGHCPCGEILSELSINAGVTNQYLEGQVIPVSCFVIHPRYTTVNYDDFRSHHFDIAVLKLTRPLRWTPTVAPIALPAAGAQLANGEILTITGWGAISEGGPSPGRLRVVTLPVFDRHECNVSYSGLVTEDMFCGGLIEGGKDSCQGDSGGPVVANGRLVGLVSWGRGCARPGYPGVYAQVSEFIDWIHEQ